nr:hypothetical protein BaRGS_005035 [Batillaria attramentaria]
MVTRKKKSLHVSFDDLVLVFEETGQHSWILRASTEDEEEVVENFDFEEDALEYGDDSVLDFLVRELVGQCTCPVQFPMVKVGEGKYKIGDSQTLIFVRVVL